MTGDKNREIPRPEGEYPSSDWLPIYDLRTPYSEDEIVDILNEAANIYIKLAAPDTDVIWAPENGHAINEALCHELNLDPSVISLMRRMPYRTDQTRGFLLQSDTYIIDYLDGDSSIQYYRSQAGVPPFDTPEGEQKILPHEICIAGGTRDGKQLYLDIRENTIREIRIQEDSDFLNPPGAVVEYPDLDHYRNYYPRHAPSYLRYHLNKIRSLELIPSGLWVYSEYLFDGEFEWVRRKMKHILTGTYGWPDNFQKAQWDLVREETWNDVLGEWKRLGEPRL